MAEEIREYNKNNNLIYGKNIFGEYWKEYDKDNNVIYFKNSHNYEEWCKYDISNNLIYYKTSYGFEHYYKYDENNKSIEITHQEFKQIERIKLYLNIKNSNRFEIMDI